MASELPRETKKSAMPMMLAAVVLVAGAAAGGLFFMSKEGMLPSDKAAVEAQANAPAAGEPAQTASQDQKASEQPSVEEAAAPTVIGEGDGAVEVGNPVVARIGEKEVTRSEVLNFITTLPEQFRQMPLQNLFPMARDQVVNNKVISEKALAANLGNDPEVQKILDQAKEQIVRNVYVERAVKASVSDTELQKAYDELKAEFGKIEETKARHILVDTEEKAREVLNKMKEGAKFEDLVQQYSTDPAKENGGDVGYFAKSDMVPEFAEAAFALGVGEYTKDPIKTQFGWHVIQAQDRRTRPVPEFDTVKPQLEAVVRQRKLAELIDQWQSEAKVEKFDINGKPESAAPEAPAKTEASEDKKS